MGLMIHSLGELPIEAQRSYYIYVLDYGWHESLSDVLTSNRELMADLASKSDSVVMWGTVGSHFTDEVLSWHSVDGKKGEEVLPAIMITTLHPRFFKQLDMERYGTGDTSNHQPMLLIPLRKICKTSTDVVQVIQGVFRDIKDKKGLPDFQVAECLRTGERGALADALILQPNISGVGLDMKALIGFFRGRNK